MARKSSIYSLAKSRRVGNYNWAKTGPVDILAAHTVQLFCLFSADATYEM